MEKKVVPLGKKNILGDCKKRRIFQQNPTKLVLISYVPAKKNIDIATWRSIG